ncbi:MAG: RNA methyltransferase, partial [Longicatena sp.]|nr:RNA methyltransferase [Longicatena sp.]
MKEEFLKRMQVYLKDEYDDYLATLSQPAYKGLRINTTKISSEAFQAEHILTLTPSAICKDAFYYDGNEVSSLGNHPAHLSGLFYIQEPSASSAVEVLDVQEGDWVLDLCAAPGGKSTQIATKLNHTGFLVANEIVQKRAMILMSNLERLGFSECMVT